MNAFAAWDGGPPPWVASAHGQKMQSALARDFGRV